MAAPADERDLAQDAARGGRRAVAAQVEIAAALDARRAARLPLDDRRRRDVDRPLAASRPAARPRAPRCAVPVSGARVRCSRCLRRGRGRRATGSYSAPLPRARRPQDAGPGVRCRRRRTATLRGGLARDREIASSRRAGERAAGALLEAARVAPACSPARRAAPVAMRWPRRRDRLRRHGEPGGPDRLDSADARERATASAARVPLEKRPRLVREVDVLVGLPEALPQAAPCLRRVRPRSAPCRRPCRTRARVRRAPAR